MGYSEATIWDRQTIQRRGAAIAIALLLEALLILAILSLGIHAIDPERKPSILSSFSLEAEPESAAAKSKSKTETAVRKSAVQNNIPIPPPLLPPVNPVKAPPSNPDFIKVSKSEFEAMDLSKLPAGDSGGGKADGNGSGQGDKGFIGPGLGPGGAQIYPVAWYREPFDSELQPYLAEAKSIPPGATADIACIMVEDYHVDNCRVLSENPRGTGAGKALRLAAWQFLVRPPRIDGKPQLGVWVRIHFDFNKKAAE